MRITQLVEGQENLIANLHTRTILRLYTPLSVQEAAKVPNHGLSSLPHHQGEPGTILKEGGIPVTHRLAWAAPYGDVVIQFNDTAMHLSVPEKYNTSNLHRAAEAKYPGSQMPIVSYLLLEKRSPAIYYHSILPSTSIDAYHLIGYDKDGHWADGDDVKATLNHRQFGTWMVNKYQRAKKILRRPWH